MAAQLYNYNQNYDFNGLNPLSQKFVSQTGSLRSFNNYNEMNNINHNLNTINVNNNELVNPIDRSFNQKNDFNNGNKIFNKAFSDGLQNLSAEEASKILMQLNNNICKIKKPNNDNATGFFCKIPFGNSTLPVLITNNHVLNKDDLKINRIVTIILKKIEKENEIEKKIVINGPRITFTDEKLDITIIEIISKVDGINDFLEVDDNFDDIVVKQEIYILHNPKEKPSFAFVALQGKSKDSKEEDIFYSCETVKGSSGSPILNLINHKVIGVHKGSEGSLKIGISMKFIVDAFKKTYDINKSKLNLNIKEKVKGTEIISLRNNEYYVGHFKNGKIAIYYGDGNLKYEGDRVDGKYEGIGTYYYNEGGNRYEGEWKKGLKHGKGILYYKHETQEKKYDGYFVKGKFEGKGIYYWNDGSYYIGDFVNGLKHGYGAYYKKDGTLKYEGGFINDKFEGNGIYYCNSGNYYIGYFKNGSKYGKGTLYHKNMML